jgi:hypothetical protein
MPIDMSLLKDFRCVLTVPKGGLVRQQQEDRSWSVVQSSERLRVLCRPSVTDRVSAEAGMLTCKFLASSAAKGGPDAQNRYLRMMFAGRAAAAKANILFDTGASANIVSKSFAKQTGITLKRLARKGARVFLAVIRPVESDFVPPVVACVAASSPDVPTSSVQPAQPAGPPGGEVP